MSAHPRVRRTQADRSAATSQALVAAAESLVRLGLLKDSRKKAA